MKILLISTNDLNDNGISTFIINNAKLLSQRNDVHVDILAPNYVDSNIKKNLKKYNVMVFRIASRNSNPCKYFFSLIKLLKKKKYDILHVNGSSTIMSIELAAGFFAGVKVRIAHSHNTVCEHKNLNRLLQFPFEFFVNKRIACNDAAGKWLFKKKPFIVINNGIFLNQYQYNSNTRQNIRHNLNIDKHDILLGHVGTFNYQKNQLFLLKVLKKMPNKYKLIFIGSGPDKDNVQKKAEKLGLKNRVIFTGTVYNVPEYLSAIDIFCLPSRFEGQPFVVIEASANGLPVILSNNVSKEVNLTGKLNFIELNIEKWVKEIKSLQLLDRCQESRDNKEKLAMNGYDILKNNNDLYEVYKESMRE